jgi:glycosyltransferase involved in cell wall biosynthesis
MAFTAQQPFISIVVPTYNRPEQVTVLLESLVRQTYSPSRFEVIVVDDGGDQPLTLEVKPYEEQLDVTLLTQDNAGPANARQNGIDVARGKILAFLDDDCVPAPNWLQILEKASFAARDCAIGGQTLNALPENPYSTASQLLITYMYGYYNRDPCCSRFFATNNLAFPADHFRAIGGLDVSWSLYGGEDRDLSRRWLDRGYRMIYVPQLMVYHAHYLTLPTFWRQHFNYGRGAFRFHFGCAQRSCLTIPFNSLSFYVRLPFFAFRQMRLRRALPITILLLISQLANVVGFFHQARQRDSRFENYLLPNR